MLSIAAPTFCDPSGYELVEVPQPSVTDPTDVVVKVHSSSINPVDVKKAAGIFKFAIKEQFPYQIGYDCAGVVIDVGKEVSSIRAGDEVYVRLPEASRANNVTGAWSEYAKCEEQFVALKPKHLSFEDAASIPLAAMTALQAMNKYKGSLSGKTVFIPAGLSGTGSCACQLAKNVFHAGKVITTVSTAKVGKVNELLGEGVVDQIIDYTKDDPNQVITPRSVDFILDTTGQAMKFLSLMTPSTSLIISISTLPSGYQLQQANVMKRPDNPQVPWYAYYGLDLMDWICKVRAWRWSVDYSYLFLSTNNSDLKALTGYIEEGKLKPVVGSRVDFRDIKKVRDTCGMVYNGKGGIGKAVINVV